MGEDIREFSRFKLHVMDDHRLSQLVHKDERFSRQQSAFSGDEYKYILKYKTSDRAAAVTITYLPTCVRVEFVELTYIPGLLAAAASERRLTSCISSEFLDDFVYVANEAAAELRHQYKDMYHQQMKPTPLEDMILSSQISDIKVGIKERKENI